MKQEHTPEPWELSLGRIAHVRQSAEISDDNIEHVRICTCLSSLDSRQIDGAGSDTDDANAARIVACVNACAGIPNPAAIAEVIATLEAILEEHDASHYSCPVFHGKDAEAPELLQAARAALRGLEGGGEATIRR